MEPQLDFAPFLLGPGATWRFMPQVDLWLWFPPAEAKRGDLNAINLLTEERFQRVQPGSQQTLSLVGQLCHVVYIKMPGKDDIEMWARSEDVARTEATPVVLAFRLPVYAGELLPTIPPTLRIATLVPPPQFGEAALVDDGEEWKPYNLSAVGSEGLEVWRQMGSRLQSLVAPADWWLHTDLLDICRSPGGFERARAELNSQLLAVRGKERDEVRAKLHALTEARTQVDAMRKSEVRWRENFDESQAAWADVRDMAQQLAGLYWKAHQSATSGISVPATVLDDELTIEAGVAQTVAEGPTPPTSDEDPAAKERDEQLALLAQINEVSSADTMLLPNFLEDETIRHAALGKDWNEDKKSGMLRYEHKSMAVYLGDPDHPMELQEAQAKLLRIRESTVLTMRIAMGLWNIRRYDANLFRNGAALISIPEILVWRDVKKHMRVAHPDPSAPHTGDEERRTDGWRKRDVDSVCEDFELAQLFYLQGQHDVYKDNKKVGTVAVSDHYMHTSFVKRRDLWGREEVVGVFTSPGNWINTYRDYDNYFLTPVNRRIFRLNPQNHQHELRIAFYLVERWREQAKKRAYAEPIAMQDLLYESVIPVNEKNLTNRFAPRIEQALEYLQEQGVIGTYQCLTPVDRSKARWGKDWLAARWRILPPDDMVTSLDAATRGGKRAALPEPGSRTKGRERGQKS